MPERRAVALDVQAVRLAVLLPGIKVLLHLCPHLCLAYTVALDIKELCVVDFVAAGIWGLPGGILGGYAHQDFLLCQNAHGIHKAAHFYILDHIDDGGHHTTMPPMEYILAMVMNCWPKAVSLYVPHPANSCPCMIEKS